MLPFQFEGDDLIFQVLMNSLIMAASVVSETLRALIQKVPTIPFDGSS